MPMLEISGKIAGDEWNESPGGLWVPFDTRSSRRPIAIDLFSGCGAATGNKTSGKPKTEQKRSPEKTGQRELFR